MLSQLHYLKASERIIHKVAVLAFKIISAGSGTNIPRYLCAEIRRPADTQARRVRRRLCSASSTSLDVGRTRLSTVGDRAFPVAAARLWNSLPSHVTAAPSLSIFCCRLKSHLFSLSYPAFWLFSHLNIARAVTRHFGYFNLYHISFRLLQPLVCPRSDFTFCALLSFASKPLREIKVPKHPSITC